MYCKDRSFFGHPDDFMVLPVPAPFRETHERGMNLSPSKLAAPSPAQMDVEPRHGPLYNQRSQQAHLTLLPTTEARGTRRRTRRKSQGADADQPVKEQKYQVK